MDADWYVDPLGRFDGRFFDGESWTERVSDKGTAAIDSDFSSTTVAAIDESDLLDQPMQAAVAPAATPRPPRGLADGRVVGSRRCGPRPARWWAAPLPKGEAGRRCSGGCWR